MKFFREVLYRVPKDKRSYSADQAWSDNFEPLQPLSWVLEILAQEDKIDLNVNTTYLDGNHWRAFRTLGLHQDVCSRINFWNTMSAPTDDDRFVKVMIGIEHEIDCIEYGGEHYVNPKRKVE